MLVGNKALRPVPITLLCNLNTKVTLIFKQTRNDFSSMPSTTLVLNGLDNYT